MGNKCRKTISPFFAHCNAAFAIVFVALVGWVKASRFGIAPSEVFPRLSISRMAMNKITVRLAAFKMSRATVSKPSTINHALIPALAPTQPTWLFFSIRGAFQYSQGAKYFTGQWNQNHRNTLSFIFRIANKAKCAKVMEP
jgi:hypothetical protein